MEDVFAELGVSDDYDFVTLGDYAAQVGADLKNISADPLNIPSEDLLRRFVRGDDSRSTPGSGLGLSIAQSLAHLQGAEFSIDIDGDLFKALVRFPESAGEN